MKKLKHATDGTTMVEVMVAFTILVLLMAMFSQAMGLAGRMMNRSSETLKTYHQLAGDYFLERADGTGDEIPTAFSFKRVTKNGQDTGDGFTISGKVRTYTKGTDTGPSRISLYEVEYAGE